MGNEDATGAGERFEDWAKEWLQTSIHLKPRTRVNYESVLRNRLLPAFGPMQIDEITQLHVRRFVANRAAVGDAPGTIRTAFTVLRSLMSAARSSGLVDANPCTGLRMPRVARQEMLFLDASQVMALSQAITSPYGTLILFAAYTEARAGEIGALRVGRLDLRRGRVEIRESLADVNGHAVFGATKTYSMRTLALPEFLVEELTAYLTGRNAAPDDLVFSTPRGDPLRHSKWYVRHFKPAVLRAGLPSRLRFHDLRHTCVALLIAQGAHPRAIMERLGHSTIDLTLGRYGHLFPSLDAGLVEGLEATYLGWFSGYLDGIFERGWDLLWERDDQVSVERRGHAGEGVQAVPPPTTFLQTGDDRLCRAHGDP